MDVDSGRYDLDEAGIKFILEKLKILPNLKKLILNLAWNFMGENGAKLVTDELKTLNNLESLSLDLA